MPNSAAVVGSGMMVIESAGSGVGAPKKSMRAVVGVVCQFQLRTVPIGNAGIVTVCCEIRKFVTLPDCGPCTPATWLNITQRADVHVRLPRPNGFPGAT